MEILTDWRLLIGSEIQAGCVREDLAGVDWVQTPD